MHWSLASLLWGTFVPLLSIIDLFLPPSAKTDLAKARPARILIALSLVGGLFEPLISLRHFLAHNWRPGSLTLGIGLFALVFPIAIRRGLPPRIAMDIMGGLIVVAGAAVSFLRGGFFISTMLASILVPLAAGLFERRRAIVVWGVVALVVNGSLALATRLGLFGLRPETAIEVAPLFVFLVASTTLALIHEQGRAALEREKEVLQQRIAMTQRLDSLGHLSAGIAHDFNNLLTVFRSAGEVMSEVLPKDHELRAEADAVCEAADRGAALARQLLVFSRPEEEANEASIFDLGDAVTSTEAILKRALPHAVSIDVTLPVSAIEVGGDEQRLMNVLLNLVVNARDAMPSGGTITVTVGTTLLAEEGGPDALPPGDYATLEVRDDGTGIDAATLPHIFEPFFTTKTRERGSGLGLASAFATVRSMKGSIRVATAVGEGTTFTILLPLRIDGTGRMKRFEPVKRAERLSPASLRAARRTILVVDDQRPVVAAVRRLLANQGFEVLTATGGLQALQMLEQQPNIDVLLTDVNMPEMDGVELSLRLRSVRPSIGVVFMTGSAHDARLDGELKRKPAGLVRKPFDVAALVAQIEGAIRQR